MASLGELLDGVLPLNLKERYYTGTVLPAIVCADDFAHLDRLATLLSVDRLDVRTDPDDCTVLFFTEYGITESLYGPSKDHFVGLPTGKDTPDVVILVTEPDHVLIALEAKLYDRPQPTDLIQQLANQYALLAPLTRQLADKLGCAVRLVHAVLLPQAYAQKIGELDTPVITWESLLDAYRGVGPRYFHVILTEALQRYAQLVSRPSTHRRPQLPGAEIIRRYRLEDTAVAWMGRQGGLDGPHLASDISTGNWHATLYQYSPTPVTNSNWFPVTDFAQRVHAQDRTTPAPPSN
jgi:hypothetical protein